MTTEASAARAWRSVLDVVGGHFLGNDVASGHSRILKWPTDSADQPSPTLFMTYAIKKVARLRRIARMSPGGINVIDFDVYPGDRMFEDVPPLLLEHIVTHDAPIDAWVDMARHELLLAVWKRYGAILFAVDFFATNATAKFVALISCEIPRLLGVLPVWLRALARQGADDFISRGQLTCGAAVDVCGDIIRRNRALLPDWRTANDIIPNDPLDISAASMAEHIRRGEYSDRVGLRIFFETDLGSHIYVIMRLENPQIGGMHDFSCQAYVFQNGLLVEEVVDLEDHLRDLASLPRLSGEDFAVVYERLFHARLSRVPTEDEWYVKPIVKVIYGGGSRFTHADAQMAAGELGVNVDVVSVDRLLVGMRVESEHGPTMGPVVDVTHGRAIDAAKIALAHFKENPGDAVGGIGDYYHYLQKYVTDVGARAWEARGGPMPRVIS